VSEIHKDNQRALRATLADIEQLLRDAAALNLGSEAQERLRWFAHAMGSGGNVRKTCEHFNISPSTFTRWALRFDPADPTSLEERSRRPRRTRTSTVAPEIIEHIRVLRTEDPHMSRECIRERLIAEKSVTLSAACIGRVIRRHKFFFAETPAHWLKRTGNDVVHVSEQKIVDHVVEQCICRVQDELTSWAATLEQERSSLLNAKLNEEQGRGNGSSSLALIVLFASIATIGIFGGSEHAYALEGSSYRLYEDFGAEATGGPLTGTDHQMEAGRETNTSMPLAGTSFQITSTSPTGSSSSSSSSISSSSSSSESGGGGGGDRSDRSRRAVPRVRNSSSARRADKGRPTRKPRVTPPRTKNAAPAAQEIAPPNIFRFQPSPVSFFLSMNTMERPPFDRMDPVNLLVQGASRGLVEGKVPGLLKDSNGISTLAILIIGALGGFMFPYRKHKIILSSGMPIVRLEYGPQTTRRRRFHQSIRFGLGIFIPFIGVTSRKNHACRTPFHINPIYGRGRSLPSYAKRGVRLDVIVIAALAGLFLFIGGTKAFAATTTPLTHTYHGHLLDSSGDAVTSAVTIRYSYWKSADFGASDLTATGSINTSATNYASWKEEHTVTPNSDGFFSVELGSTTALPAMNGLPLSTILSLYLQVDVKASSAADSTYDLLDANASDATKDRSPVLSVPFSLNADMLDQRDTGTASGSIPVLKTGGVLPVSVIPSGTTQSGFTLDTNNAATGDITLQFGQSLGKKLIYDQSNTWFNFNDDLRVQGDLTVTGLINGVTVSALQSATGALKVASGGGLSITVDAGSYRLRGVVTNFAGQSGVAVTASATNYVFFGSGGLTVRTATFPSDESYIPLAEVTTNGVSVTSVADRRALSSDDREQTVVRTYHAGFEGASYQGDASDNVGQLFVDHDNTSDRNYYRWTSSLASLQDYDLILRVTLPADFVRWKDNPLKLTYRSTSADASDSQLDVSVFDTNGTPVSLSGSSLSSGLNLVGTSWATEQIEWSGAPTWTAGQDFLISLKMQAKNDKQIHIGDLFLQYTELPSE